MICEDRETIKLQIRAEGLEFPYNHEAFAFRCRLFLFGVVF